jgi:hypothetical protein
MTGFFLGLLGLAWFPIGITTPSNCSIALNRFFRPKNPSYLIVRATTDSISDGAYHFGDDGFSRLPSSLAPSKVYAQVFHVISAHGPGAAAVRGHSQVALVWWRLGASCQRWVPRAALKVESGDAFVLKQPRPRSDWIEDMPTFDIEVADWVYAPALARRYLAQTGAVREMTVPEFLRLFSLLPTEAGARNPEPLKRLLAWGAQDSTRWLLDPARLALCSAHAMLTLTSDCPKPRP